MVKRTLDFDIVRKIGRSLPGVQESKYFGQPALKSGGHMFACMASHRSAEPGSLVVLIDTARRQALIEEAPDVYNLTDHYVGSPSALVRLEKIDPEALRGLLVGAMQFVQMKQSSRLGVRRRTAGRR